MKILTGREKKPKTIVQIIGQPGSGKTTLVADLVRYFTQEGLSVGTIKHSSHGHELDTPGKDSHVHRTAGANPSAMVTSKMAAVYLPASEYTDPNFLINTYYTHADIVLIEGWISGPYPKLEIWRKAIEKKPLFPGFKGVHALVSNDTPTGQLESTWKNTPIILPFDPVSKIADFIRNMD